MVEAIANACAVPAFTKKSAAKPVRAIVGAIARSAADAPLTASGCGVPAFTKKSAAKPVRAIAGAIAASALAVATDAQARARFTSWITPSFAQAEATSANGSTTQASCRRVRQMGGRVL